MCESDFLAKLSFDADDDDQLMRGNATIWNDQFDCYWL